MVSDGNIDDMKTYALYSKKLNWKYNKEGKKCHKWSGIEVSDVIIKISDAK